MPHLAAAALLSVALAAFFWRVTLEQRVLSPADLEFTAYPWAAEAPDGYKGPSNPYQSDDAEIFYPRRADLYEGDTGDSWWQDDYLSGGRNGFFVDALGLQFYPPAWVFYVLPLPVANSLYGMLALLAAGLSMYALLWQLRLPWLASVYGAVAYAFNGHFIVWTGHAYLPAQLGLVPLTLFGFERYRETRQALWLLVAAACIAVVVYIAYIPGWIVMGVVLVIYGLVRLAPLAAAGKTREWLGLAGVYVGTGLLGLGLSAYALIPSVVSAAESSYQTGRSFGLGFYPLEFAWTYMFPDFWGSFRHWMGPVGNPPEAIGYAGVSAIPPALLGLWRIRQKAAWLGWFSVGVLAFSAAQVYGIPPLKEFAHLPGIKQVTAGRWIYGLNLTAALLAASGVALLLDKDVPPRTRRALAVATGGLAVLGLLAVMVVYLGQRWDANWAAVTEGQGAVAAPWDLVADGSTPFHRGIGFLVLAAGGVVLALWRPGTSRVVACGLAVLLFADVFAWGSEYNATVKKGDMYPETPAIEFLQEREGWFRVAPVASDGRNNVMPGYSGTVSGLRVITGYDHYKDPDYLAFLDPMRSPRDKQLIQAGGYVMVGSDRQRLNEGLLSLLGVRYVVTGPAGLWFGMDGQQVNDSVFPVYGGLRQGQEMQVPEGADGVEFLVNMSGQPEAEWVMRFTVRRGPDDEEVLARTEVRAGDLLDSSWQQVKLGGGAVEGRVYIEVEAPEATEQRPFLLWGSNISVPAGVQRFQGGAPVPGALTFRILDAPGPWVEEVYKGADATIYELRRPMPLAWGVGRAEVLADREAVMARITTEGFKGEDVALFTEEDAEGRVAEGGGSGRFEAMVVDNDSERLRVKADFSGPGWVMVSRRWDRGWRARVDGEGTEVLRADGVLQAVAVPEGEHEVEMYFEPREYVWGKWISVLTAALVVVGVAGYRWRRKEGRAEEGRTTG